MAFVLARACLSAAAAISAFASLPMAGCSTPPDAVEERRIEISTPPIAHVVLITLKDPTRAAELVEDCNRLVPGIPSVLAYSCGLPLPSDRANVVGDYSVGFFVAFADEAGYREYTDHPSHLALVDKWRTAWKEVRIFDFVDGMVPLPQASPVEPAPSTDPKGTPPTGAAPSSPPAADPPSGAPAPPGGGPEPAPPAKANGSGTPANAHPSNPSAAPAPATAPKSARRSGTPGAAAHPTTTLAPNGH